MAETHVHEDEHVVHHHDDRGSNNGLLLGVILLIVVLFLFFFYGLPYIRGLASPQVAVPEQVDVNVQGGSE